MSPTIFDRFFTKTVITALLRAAAEGHPPSGCARLAGINPRTLSIWLDRGGDDTSKDFEKYHKFAIDFHAASTKLTDLALAAVRDAMEEGDAQVALKFLSMHPSTAAEFSPTRRTQSEVNVQIDAGTGIRASIDASLKELLALQSGATAIIDVQEIEEAELEEDTSS